MRGPTASTKGILRPQEARAHFSLRRHAPAADLARWIERHWVVAWDLQAPFVQELLPHPSVNVVFAPEGAGVHGVATGRWSRHLEGAGMAVGTKFRPGAFAGFFDRPMAELTDRTLTLGEVFGPAGSELERRVRHDDDVATTIGAVERFFRARRPAPDPQLDLVLTIVGAMLAAPAGTRVEAFAADHGMSPRTLQRLFRRYVGVSPKWVLQRYRLHEAAERMAAGEAGDWPDLALELGYFDQSHFIRDFSGFVGQTPTAYAARCEQALAAT
jgi:AraC-like DNA-binding protein